MARRDQRQTSTFSRQVLESPDLQRSISLLTDIVSSCYGPFGKIKTVQNSSGGHVTLTSTSQRLFKVLSFSKPVLKLIVGSIQCHLKSFNDGGLFSTAFTLHLIKEGLNLEIHRRLIVEAYDLFLGIAIDYLKSEDCQVKYSLKKSGLCEILKLTKSIIEPKWHGCHSRSNLDFIVHLTVDAFLKSVSDSHTRTSTPENVYFVFASGHVVTESKLFCGVLLDLCGRAAPSPVNLKCIEDLLLCGNRIPVVVVNVSMAGDLEDFIQAGAYDIAVEVDVDAISKSRLQSFAQTLVEMGAKVVFCQKVIHPDIKTYLRHSGVFAVDRLGAAACRTVQQLTGARFIGIISDNVDSSSLASLESLSVEVIFGKSYLLLSGDSPDVTVVLCHRQEEILEEIKVACEAAIHSLYINLHQPEVLTGGGCWQVHLAHYLQSQVFQDTDHLTRKLSCSYFQLLTVCSAFARSLQLCAISIGQPKGGHLIDSANHHLWRAGDSILKDQENVEPIKTCCCGSIYKTDKSKVSFLNLASDNSVLRMNVQVSENTNTSSSETDFINPSIDQIEENENVLDNRAGRILETSEKLQPGKSEIRKPGTSENVQTHSVQKDLSRIQVFDSFPVLLNALHTAVSSAMAVLSISQYIQDTN